MEYYRAEFISYFREEYVMIFSQNINQINLQKYIESII